MKSTTIDPYHSRVDRWELAERQDPVVHGSLEGPLDEREIQEFASRGYLFRESLFDESEVSVLLERAEKLREEARDRDPLEGVVREPGSEVVRSVFRLHRDELFRSLFLTDPRILEPIRQLLGSEVYVHQSRINFKPAFDGKEFFWHSDFETWHIEDGMPRMRAISVVLNLTPTNPYNGPLMVIPGSHRHYVRCEGRTPEDHFRESLRKQDYGVPSREALERLVRLSPDGIQAPVGPAGSVLFFESNLMHGSGGNLSPFPRAGLFIVYNSVENGLVEPFGGLPPRPDFLAERRVEPLP